MAAAQNPKTRSSKKATDDGKGERRMIAGKRFRTPGVHGAEAKKRLDRIEDLWKDNETFCTLHLQVAPSWNHIAKWAAEAIRLGERRIPIPPLDDVIATYDEADAVLPQKISDVLWRYTDDDGATSMAATVEGIESVEAIDVYEIVAEAFPTVNWGLPKQHSDVQIKTYEQNARTSIAKLAKARDHSPPDPSTPLINGTFHEALTAYEEKRRQEFTEPDGTFDGSGHQWLGIIKAIKERRSDFQLAELDFHKCQNELDFWRERPEDRRPKMKGSYLARKTCQGYVGELVRFFEWLHLSSEYGWRKPQDFSSLKKDIRRLKSDRRSVHEMEIKTFSMDELVTLYKNAIPSERFLITWCLNCAHGAAEIGRVEWGDLFLSQEHPWKSQGLKIACSSDDSWCGFTRPKSDVIGWWWLWPETVKLLQWLRQERINRLGKEPDPSERILLTEMGEPIYRDASKNAQSSFGNAWTRLKQRVKSNNPEAKVTSLSFGTLRNQMPDWLGGDQAKALVASVALCHGIPHKGDKLLYRHYANRPWGALFESQREFRLYMRPVLESVSDPTTEPDPLGDKIRTLARHSL